MDSLITVPFLSSIHPPFKINKIEMSGSFPGQIMLACSYLCIWKVFLNLFLELSSMIARVMSALNFLMFFCVWFFFFLIHAVAF